MEINKILIKIGTFFRYFGVASIFFMLGASDRIIARDGIFQLRIHLIMAVIILIFGIIFGLTKKRGGKR